MQELERREIEQKTIGKGRRGEDFGRLNLLLCEPQAKKKYTKKPVSYVGYLNHRLSAPCNGIRIPEFIREIFNYGESSNFFTGRIRNPGLWNPESY